MEVTLDDSDTIDLHAYEEDDWSEEDNRTVADILKGPALETPADDRLSDVENGEPRFSKTRPTHPQATTPSFASIVAGNKQSLKEKRKAAKSQKDDAPDQSLFTHKLLTASTVLQQELGPPRPTLPAAQ